MSQNSAFQIAAKLPLHVPRHALAIIVPLAGERQVGLHMVLHRAVQGCALGAAPAVDAAAGRGLDREVHATGAGRRKDADALVMHAIVVNVALGVLFSVLFLVFGAPLYRAMGDEGASLRAALDYSNVVFAGAVLVWVMNALASVVRGTGNMLVPSLAVCGGVLLLVPLSPLLIFGLGPVPGFGIAGGALAVLLTTALSAGAFRWYSGSAHRWLRWWGPTSAPASEGERFASHSLAARSPSR